MQIFVKFEVFDTITGDAEVDRVRKAFAQHTQWMMESGKVAASGIFADGRAGFFLLNVETGEDVLRLLGGPVLDNCRVETHPVISLSKLGEFFRKEPAGYVPDLAHEL